MDNSCGIVADERFLHHKTGAHVECPERLKVIYDMLKSERLMEKLITIEARHATEAEVALNHSFSYINMLKGMGAGHLDSDTVLSEESFDVALLAVGGCLNMVDAIIAGEISRGFAFVRPPGHHAERERGMGFCLFNNIAIAARHLIKQHSLKRVVILDWDLHHGNGTQHSFYNEKEVLYVSIHQSPCYSGTGAITEVGTGEGEGYTVNLPIPAGVGDAGYLKAFDELFIPIISSYRPEIILVSAGFDTYIDDPLGGMKVSARGFGAMTKRLVDTAETVCDSKIAFFLEGGYSLSGLKESVREVIMTVLSKETANEFFGKDSFVDGFLEKAKFIQRKYWHGI